MRRLLFITLALTFTPALAHAQGYASAQAAVGSPQAAIVSPQAALAPAYDTCNAGAALAAPVLQSYAVPQQQIVVQRQIVAQPVYVQQAPVVVQRQVYAAPVLQQAIVSPYVQSQALANVGYGVGAQNGLVVNRGLRARGVGAQKTVSRSRAVTVTRRPGIVNRVLGR